MCKTMQPHLLGQTLSAEKGKKLEVVPIERPLSHKKKCCAAQMVVRRLAVRQARVQISARHRHPMEVQPTAPAAVKIWRWATENVKNEFMYECMYCKIEK
jgi:hypothetical protein